MLACQDGHGEDASSEADEGVSLDDDLENGQQRLRVVWRSRRRKQTQPQRGGRLKRAGWSKRPGTTSAANTGGLDSQPWTDEEEEMERDATKGERPAQSLGRAEIERSVTGGSVEGDSRRLVGPAARGEVVWPIDRDRASSYAQSGGARRGTHLT